MIRRAPGLRSWIPAAILLALTIGTRAEADIILLLSKTNYAIGERVEFALVNASEHVIAVPYTHWWRITDSQGGVVDGCQTDPQEVEIQPGDYLLSEWNQVDCADDRPVALGRYRVDAFYTSDCCPGLTSVEGIFEIGTTAVEPTSWGRIKATFEGGPSLPRPTR
jgi:hypothetical protein